MSIIAHSIFITEKITARIYCDSLPHLDSVRTSFPGHPSFPSSAICIYRCIKCSAGFETFAFDFPVLTQRSIKNHEKGGKCHFYPERIRKCPKSQEGSCPEKLGFLPTDRWGLCPKGLVSYKKYPRFAASLLLLWNVQRANEYNCHKEHSAVVAALCVNKEKSLVTLCTGKLPPPQLTSWHLLGTSLSTLPGRAASVSRVSESPDH